MAKMSVLIPFDPPSTPIVWKKGFYTDRKGFVFTTRIDTASLSPVSSSSFKNYVLNYKKRSVKRMKVFLAESERMDVKVTQILEKLKEAGVVLEKVSGDKDELEKISNWRKKPKSFSLQMDFKRGTTELVGTLKVTPATVKLFLCDPTIEFRLPIFSASFYRTLIFKDNSLAAMVKGVKVSAKNFETEYAI